MTNFERFIASMLAAVPINVFLDQLIGGSHPAFSWVGLCTSFCAFALGAVYVKYMTS